MGFTLAFLFFLSQVYGDLQSVSVEVQPVEDLVKDVEIEIDDLEDVKFVEKTANQTKVNLTLLEAELKLLEKNVDLDLDFEYIEKNFNETDTSLNETEQVEVEEYDVDEEKDEITAPDNEDVENTDDTDDVEEFLEKDVHEFQKKDEVSANGTQVDVNMTAVNQTELEEILKEIEEQGEELDFE